jgi:fucose 4-O-acetylase-like acetyltransferase
MLERVQINQDPGGYAPSGTAVAQRVASIDIVKGIAIFLVVFGHGIGGITSSKCCGTSDHVRYIVYFIYTFHMPVFFFVSGLLTHHRAEPTGRSLARVGTSLVYPYFLWSALQLSLAILASGSVNRTRDFGDFLKVLYDPLDHFWFLFTLCILKVLEVLVISKLSRGAIVAAVGLTAALYLWLFGAHGEPGNLNNLLYGMIYYLLGRCFGSAGQPSFNLTRFAASLTAAAPLALIAFVAVGMTFDIHARSMIPAALAGIATVFVISAHLEKQNGMLSAALASMGRYSMAIYLAHVIASALARALLVQAFGQVGYWTAVAVVTAAGIALPIALALIAKRCGMLDYLGFGRGPQFGSGAQTDERRGA